MLEQLYQRFVMTGFAKDGQVANKAGRVFADDQPRFMLDARSLDSTPYVASFDRAGLTRNLVSTCRARCEIIVTEASTACVAPRIAEEAR